MKSQESWPFGQFSGQLDALAWTVRSEQMDIVVFVLESLTESISGRVDCMNLKVPGVVLTCSLRPFGGVTKNVWREILFRKNCIVVVVGTGSMSLVSFCGDFVYTPCGAFVRRCVCPISLLQQISLTRFRAVTMLDGPALTMSCESRIFVFWSKGIWYSLQTVWCS